MTIGQKIKEIRQRNSLSMEDVAKASGVTRQRIFAIESDKYFPTIPTIQLMAKGLHCSPMDILTEPLTGEHEKNLVPKAAPCANSGFCPFYKKGE